MSKPFKIAYAIALAFLLFGVIKFFLPDNYEQVSNHVCIKGNINDDEVQEVERYIDCLPPVLKQKFSDEGWRVCVTDDISDKVVGRTVIEDKMVYIKAGYELQCLMHEFAHIYLHEHPFGDDFKEIYESEAKDMIVAYYGEDSEYDYSDITEYYCSAWNIVIWVGQDTYDAAPQTFAYFNDLFNEIYG